MKKIKIRDSLIIRKEWFGLLVYNFLGDSYRQYNTDAEKIIGKLMIPRSIEELKYELKKDGFRIPLRQLTAFLCQCIADGILIETDSAEPSRAYSFFMGIERESMRRDCLFRPSGVSIYITNACTKKCLHCVARAQPTPLKEELRIADWKIILQKLRKEGVITLAITGGEPLLKDGIFDLLSFADTLMFSYSLLTDYDGLEEKHLDSLRSLKYLNGIQVSLDGALAETHDFLRGQGSFFSAIKRLTLLKNSGLPYTISTTVHKKNVAELKGIAKIYHQFGATSLYLNPLAPFGRGESLMKYVLSDQELRALALDYVRLIQSEGINPGNEYWQMISSEDDLDANFHPLKDTPDAISLGTFNLAINSLGTCYLDSKMASLNMFPLGNILKTKLADIWNNPSVEDLRSRYVPGSFSFIPLGEIS
jgi:MoaA/NifB/PqqE/SkfB family radical SAM enzyme